jgi:hypothetical protein
MTTSPILHIQFPEICKAFCEDKINELLPFDLSKLKDISDENLIIQKEILLDLCKTVKSRKKRCGSIFKENCIRNCPNNDRQTLKSVNH